MACVVTQSRQDCSQGGYPFGGLLSLLPSFLLVSADCVRLISYRKQTVISGPRQSI